MATGASTRSAVSTALALLSLLGEFESGIISTLGADAPTAQGRVPIAHSPASPSLGGNTLDPNCSSGDFICVVWTLETLSLSRCTHFSFPVWQITCSSPGRFLSDCFPTVTQFRGALKHREYSLDFGGHLGSTVPNTTLLSVDALKGNGAVNGERGHGFFCVPLISIQTASKGNSAVLHLLSRLISQWRLIS